LILVLLFLCNYSVKQRIRKGMIIKYLSLNNRKVLSVQHSPKTNDIYKCTYTFSMLLQIVLRIIIANLSADNIKSEISESKLISKILLYNYLCQNSVTIIKYSIYSKTK